MEYILGVDGGGTKTTAVIKGTTGETMGEATSGASSFRSVSIIEAIENLNKAVFGAIKNAGIGNSIIFKSSCFGFAGFNVPNDLKFYRKIAGNDKLKRHLNQKNIFICNDTRIGLEAGSGAANKIIIIAGTGSNCFGINESGEQAGSTGWDHILADEGSGYSVSVKALRAIMRAYDGRGERTMLAEVILEDLGLEDEIGIVSWIYGRPFSKERIGRFAELVCRCAYDGDLKSREILCEEAMEAILSITTVAGKLKFSKMKFDLVFVGGLFKCEKYFKDIVKNGIKERFDRVCFKPLVSKPVEGAVKLDINNLERKSDV